jgi:AraC family transcriptional regulator
MQQEGNVLAEVEALEKFIPFAPSETSYGMGWKSVQAVRHRDVPAIGEFSLPPVSLHAITLTLRPPEKLYVRSEGLKLDRPVPAGSISLIPAGSTVQVDWQGSRDWLRIYLEPSIVARVATESFEFDSTRTVVPAFYSPDAPGLRSAIMAVYNELRVGGGDGQQLLVESLATILSVHLIRRITGAHRPSPTAEAVLPGPKLRTVTEYVMDNLHGGLTLKRMASVANLSPYEFVRQFKAATGLTPYQYVIHSRVERARQLLRTHGKLSLAEVAVRTGFSDQSHFTSLFKRIIGVTPRQFRLSAGIS